MKLKWPYFSSAWCDTHVVGHAGSCVCWCDLDPIQGQGHRALEFPKIAENWTFLGQSPPPFSRGSQNWWLVMIVHGNWSTACRSPIFAFPSRKAIARVQTLQNVDISRNSNGHISVMREATVRWLGMLLVLQVLCMLMWPWPDPRSQSRSRGFWTLVSFQMWFHVKIKIF